MDMLLILSETSLACMPKKDATEEGLEVRITERLPGVSAAGLFVASNKLSLQRACGLGCIANRTLAGNDGRGAFPPPLLLNRLRITGRNPAMFRGDSILLGEDNQYRMLGECQDVFCRQVWGYASL